MTQLLTGTLAASRKKELRNLKRFEGAGVDDTNNITPLSMYSSQSIANSIIREDVEEVNI